MSRKQELENEAREIEQKNRETAVMDVTAEGIEVRNIFTLAETTVLSAEEAAEWSRRESEGWVANYTNDRR